MKLCKRLTFTLLLLSITCVSQSGYAEERIVVTGSRIDRVFVQDYAVDELHTWHRLKDLQIIAPGPVGTTALTMPNASGQFDLYYTYEGVNDAELRQVRLNIETFEVLVDRTLPKYGSDSYAVLTYATKSNKNRFGYYEDEDLKTRKLRPNGNLGAGKGRLFNNDNPFINISGSVNWEGSVASEVVYHPVDQFLYLNLRNLNKKGKGSGAPITYGLNGGVINISLSDTFTQPFPHYFAAFREFESTSTKDTTGIFLQQLDINHVPVGNAFKIAGFKATQFLDVLVFNTTLVYDDWVLFAKEDSCNKLTLNARRFNTETGKPIGKAQKLIGCKDELLSDAPLIYGFAAVGFHYNPPPNSVR